MARSVNIVMVFVWIISQTLLVAHSHAHTVMSHNQHTGLSADCTSHTGIHSHEQSTKQVADDVTTAVPDDEVPARLPHATDECCEIACQSATALHSPDLMPLPVVAVTFDMSTKWVTCWSPGSITPPPNPTT